MGTLCAAAATTATASKPTTVCGTIPGVKLGQAYLVNGRHQRH